MKSGLSAYFELIYSELDCYATWPPGIGITVGDIGRVSQSGTFMRTGDLSSRAYLPPTLDTVEPAQTISTSHGVTFSINAEVHADDLIRMLADAGATLDISFANAAAAALILQDVVRREFVDEQAVRALMTSMLNERKLDENEVIVTYVKQAGSGVVATTYNVESGADVDIEVGLGQGLIRVAEIDGHLKVVAQRGSQTVAVAEPGKPLTPVYRALALHRNRNWWSFWRSSLDVQPIIPVRSFGDGAHDSHVILPDRPSLAIPMGEID
jgi:hypothetical protein